MPVFLMILWYWYIGFRAYQKFFCISSKTSFLRFPSIICTQQDPNFVTGSHFRIPSSSKHKPSSTQCLASTWSSINDPWVAGEWGIPRNSLPLFFFFPPLLPWLTPFPTPWPPSSQTHQVSFPSQNSLWLNCPSPQYPYGSFLKLPRALGISQFNSELFSIHWIH